MGEKGSRERFSRLAAVALVIFGLMLIVIAKYSSESLLPQLDTAKTRLAMRRIEVAALKDRSLHQMLTENGTVIPSADDVLLDKQMSGVADEYDRKMGTVNFGFNHPDSMEPSAWKVGGDDTADR